MHQITQDEYFKGIEFCNCNLRGRLVLNKCDKPYTTKDIIVKLMKKWKTSGKRKMVSLGRGYYEFSFVSYGDLRSVWAMGTTNMKLGVLRLIEWTKDFNAFTHR